MGRKTIFFDIDFTLFGEKDGRYFQIPQSTREGIKLLKQNGHVPVICSGRQSAFIKKYFSGMFDSYIALNGAHIVYGGKTIFDLEIPQKRIKELMDIFDKNNFKYIFDGKCSSWARNIPENKKSGVDAIYGIEGSILYDWEPEDVHANRAEFIFSDKGECEKAQALLPGGMALSPNPGGLSADLCFPGTDKASGIKRFLEHSGTDRADAYAFGDGYNDITMMSAVGHGIAMGNAVDEVKREASYVTSDIFDDGIYNGLKHFGLI